MPAAKRAGNRNRKILKLTIAGLIVGGTAETAVTFLGVMPAMAATIAKLSVGGNKVSNCPGTHVLDATYGGGTFTGVFCLNANGIGTYTQYSGTTETAKGTGEVLTSGGTTVVAASGPGLALLGEETSTSSTFTETAPAPMKTGTFTLT